MHSEDDRVIVALYPAFRQQTDKKQSTRQHIPHPELHTPERGLVLEMSVHLALPMSMVL